jgi:hypothetical protein
MSDAAIGVGPPAATVVIPAVDVAGSAEHNPAANDTSQIRIASDCQRFIP